MRLLARSRWAVMLVAAAMVPSLHVGVAPALAVEPPSAVISSTGFDLTQVDQFYVYTVAMYDSRELVRAIAWNALVSDDVPAALELFFGSELPYVTGLADERSAQNADYARRILATHTPEYSPEVHAGAREALTDGPAALEIFVATGYEQARQRDRAVREADGERATALVHEDRKFVAELRDKDPGKQVREAAEYALRGEATDADLVEFFAHDWVAAAAVDRQTQQLRCTNSDMVRRSGLEQLMEDAEAAEEAARGAADQAQARDKAVRAWRAVGAEAGPARTMWAEAELVALRQAETWHDIAVRAAGAAENPNWAAVSGGALTNAELWDIERDKAASRAAYWAELGKQALAGETRVRSGAVA